MPAADCVITSPRDSSAGVGLRMGTVVVGWFGMGVTLVQLCTVVFNTID